MGLSQASMGVGAPGNREMYAMIEGWRSYLGVRGAAGFVTAAGSLIRCKGDGR
jgi:hypothetical protein